MAKDNVEVEIKVKVSRNKFEQIEKLRRYPRAEPVALYITNAVGI